MKTLSLLREGNNMPSMIISSPSHSENKSRQSPPVNTIASGNVERVYDSQLNNNIRMWRENRETMGHPGHYFHKPLNGVTENSRSQSLPSCLNERKLNGVQGEPERVETPPTASTENGASLKENVIAAKLAWFRTWPERGSDKFTAPHNTVNNSNGVGEDCVDSYAGNMVSVPLTNGVHSSNNKNNFNCLASNESPRKINGDVEEKDSSNFCQASYDCDNSQSGFPVQNSLGSIPLSEILENMPLAYSPITRQLHIINQNYVQRPISAAGEGKQSPQRDYSTTRNGVKLLDSIVEESGSLERNCDDAISYESPRSTLQRIGVYENSLARTDASSFSSIVSSLSESSPSTNEDLLHGNAVDSDSFLSPEEMHENLSSCDSSTCLEETGAKPKRRGISGFFSRNVFSWKLSRDHPPSAPASPASSPASLSATASTWKIFGKAAKLRPEAADEDNISIGSSGAKQYEDIVASSSALILHQRPSNLPAKSLDEELKHRQEYERMVEAARKKELKEAKLRKKQLQKQLKLEEQLASAARIWNNEILPKWDTMKSSKKAQDLWWQGIPPSVRGKIWRLAIGNDLNITHQLYEICVTRAQERLKAASEAQEGSAETFADNPDKESSVELIQLDIARTFPNLCIFQKVMISSGSRPNYMSKTMHLQGGPYYDMLHSLLGAYCCYRPDVGYVQGMSFIAAVLILNLEAADAFISFANLLNQPCHMAFFRLHQPMMQAYYATYNDFFRENLPRLYSHFSESSLSADLYLLDWLYTVFAKAMPLDVACRVWDVFLRDGEEFLFKTALGVLHLHQDALLQLDFLHGAQFLTKLPDDLAADQLFKSIEAIRMNVGKLRFSEVLASHIESAREPS